MGMRKNRICDLDCAGWKIETRRLLRNQEIFEQQRNPRRRWATRWIPSIYDLSLSEQCD